MEEAILLYRDAPGISRITGLSSRELHEAGVYVGYDIEFGFVSTWDFDIPVQPAPYGVPTDRLLHDNPAYRLYMELKKAGRVFNHSTYKKSHFYRVLTAGNAAG